MSAGTAVVRREPQVAVVPLDQIQLEEVGAGAANVDAWLPDISGGLSRLIESRLSRADSPSWATSGRWQKKRMEDEKVSDFSVGLLFFLMNSIKALSLTKEDESIFFAVSFTDFDLFAEQGVLMPNIFVYPAAGPTGLVKKIEARQTNANPREISEVKKHF